MSDAGLGHYKPAHEGHAKHEYEVFHVDFERVEIPFIIALWIFVSSLAKIGEYSLLPPFLFSKNSCKDPKKEEQCMAHKNQ